MTKKRKYKLSHWELTGMLVPGMLFALIFSYLPMIGIIVAFKNYKYNMGIFGSPWVGFNNFKFIFKSETFYTLLRNTLGYGLTSIVLGIVVGIILALMMDAVKNKVAIKSFQSCMLLPYFLSWIVISYVSHALFAYENGIINTILQKVGIEGISFYSEEKYWPTILLSFGAWKGMGFNALVYYGSILSIENDLYEAATLDGCNYLQRVRFIVLPHLKHTVIILFILALGGVFKSDTGMFLFLTKDSGPLYNVTDVFDTYVLRTLREGGSVGESSAIGFLQSIAGFVLVMVTNTCVKKIDKDSAMF